MKRHNAILKDENLLTLFSLNNLIVPEIQREYVWGNNPEVLERFLNDLKNKAELCNKCHHVHTDKNVNVGFLYSYKPPYVKFESDRILDEYLIDGQQRITTLFLLLLYRAAVEGRVNDFMTIFRVEKESFEMGFNYKVRDLTQRFIMQLLDHVKKLETKAFDFLDDLDNNSPSWILGDYRIDPTVKSMLSALKSIRNVFDNTENLYFDYLLINIHFWHFKTETTSQGEELYITMNSRGEQLSDNEMKKARAIPNVKLIEYGQKWENWQAIFWRKRGDNNNADKGFNNYLSSIEGLERFMASDRSERPSITTIETYMKALEYVTGDYFGGEVKRLYPGMYTAWFDAFITELWKQINKYDGVWNIIDPRGKGPEVFKDYRNKTQARNLSMLFWPWMYYFKTLKSETEINAQLLIRIIHFYFVRYNCFKRATTSIKEIVENMKNKPNEIQNMEPDDTGDDDDGDNTNSKIFSKEEIRIFNIVYFQPKDCKNKMESLIWEIQDLPYFRDGKDVGGNTIVDYLNNKDIVDNSNIESSLIDLKNDITGILKDGVLEEGNILVKEILLFYLDDQKAFWKQQSPWYYTNYETSEWKRIVRTRHFLNFFVEYRKARKDNTATDLSSFLESKRNKFFEDNTILTAPLDHRTLCILYDFLTGNKLWDDDHKNITFKNDPNSTKELYSGQDTLWRGKRYVDSNSQVRLPDGWQNKLKERNVQINVPTVASSSSPADEK